MLRKSLTGLLVLLAAPALAAAEDPRATVTVTPPDLSRYDCAAAAGPAAMGSAHIGQVILGRYYEWNEIYGGDKGEQLLCIGMRVPEARSLTAAEAGTFLAHAAAIGAPTPAAASTPGIETQAGDLDAIPEPAKRLRKGAPAAPDNDLPPVPAEHRPGDPNIPNPVAPAPEKPAVAPSSPNAWEKSAAADPRSEIISSAQSYPYNTLGYFTVTYPNNGNYRCTGTLVSPYVVLTAGHCIHNNSRGGWVTAVRFYPGQYVSASGALTRPYGSNTALANLKTTQNWTQISGPDEYAVRDYRYDYAAIQFSQAFTHTSTFMPVVYGSVTSPANNAGYPGTIKDSSATQYGMFATSGDETSDSILSLRNSHVREFALYSSGGDSGGPFWSFDGSRRALMGSLSYSSDDETSSGGPWYDASSQALLASWVSWTPSSAASSLPTTGLKAGAVFSSLSPASQSFLRFYNSGTTAATVSVTLSDYSTGTPLAQWTSPSIAPGASPQFSISTIESGSNPPSFAKPSYYSLAIQSGFTGSFQHVLWRVADGSLTNLSTCDSLPTAARTTLINVHSSLLQSGYPSQVVIFNTGAAAANATLGIYDAATGARIGTYTANAIPANGQALATVVSIENGAGISPNGRFHYNIKLENAFTGFLQHLVNNQQSGVTTDMTGVCPLVRSTG